MSPMEARITSLEAQVNALAQAWLYLAAHVEIQCGLNMESMEAAMCRQQWPDNPDIDQEARETLQWLRLEAEFARLMRRVRQPGGSRLRN